MKSGTDPRHINREHALKSLFQYTYTHDVGEQELAHLVIEKGDVIDEVITVSAPEWPLEKLNRVDLSILRLAVYELKYTDIPEKVVIDEAVELAKQYGAENSPRFINGALGAALKIVKNADDEVEDTKTKELVTEN